MRSFRRLFLPLLLLLTVALVAATACQVLRQERSRQSPTPSPTAIPPEFQRVLEVWQVLTQESALKEKADPETLSRAAIQGMLTAIGDYYGAFLDPEEYRIETQDFSGRFEGIGTHVVLQEGKVTVVMPFPGGPAEQAGLQEGDIILEVDGQSLEGKTLSEAVSLVRGPKETRVSLLVLKKGSATPQLIEIVRDSIQVSSVNWRMLTDSVAQIGLSFFGENTTKELKEALQEAERQGAKGAVLDLRNNQGGLVTSSVEVASQFLTPDKGLVLYEINGAGERKDWGIQAGGVATELPLVVLVNRFTASAAEVVAGALQSHGRASLIGETTFGKGSVTLLRHINGGYALNFTSSRWYTPSGRLIEGRGLTPDLVVRLPANATSDLQLQRAVEELLVLMKAATSP